MGFVYLRHKSLMMLYINSSSFLLTERLETVDLYTFVS